MPIESAMPSSHFILCHPLLLLSLIPPNIRVFSSELALCISWPKYWNCSFSIRPSNEYSGFISFRISWFDQTLKSLLQHHNSKASIICCSAFFVVQLSHLYITTGKTIALTIWTSVNKVMSLLFNTMSWFVIGFLPKSKCLLMSWLCSPSTVIVEAQENKIFHCFHFFPIYLHEVMGLDTMTFIF